MAELSGVRERRAPWGGRTRGKTRATPRVRCRLLTGTTSAHLSARKGAPLRAVAAAAVAAVAPPHPHGAVAVDREGVAPSSHEDSLDSLRKLHLGEQRVRARRIQRVAPSVYAGTRKRSLRAWGAASSGTKGALRGDSAQGGGCSVRRLGRVESARRRPTRTPRLSPSPGNAERGKGRAIQAAAYKQQAKAEQGDDRRTLKSCDSSPRLSRRVNPSAGEWRTRSEARTEATSAMSTRPSTSSAGTAGPPLIASRRPHGPGNADLVRPPREAPAGLALARWPARTRKPQRGRGRESQKEEER